MEGTLILVSRYEAEKPFLLENDLREWVRDLARSEVWGPDLRPYLWWVEPGIGGTDGYPDLTLAEKGRVVFVELKVGILRKDGSWKVKFRPSQRLVLREMVQAGLSCMVLVGLVGGRSVVVAKVDGRGPMDVLHEPRGAKEKCVSFLAKDLLGEA
jgi:hypothetical protein